jgi:ABC-type uncharacterized transport system substrate-binding protein
MAMAAVSIHRMRQDSSKLSRRTWLAATGVLLAGSGASLGCRPEPRRVLYVNSYHRGYPSSDEVSDAIHEILGAEPLELETHHLDGKRKPADLPKAAANVAKRVEEWNPHAILVSDDDAMQHLVVPHLRSGPTPVVFCGVNWSAEDYGVPNRFVTGMIEVLPVEATLRMLLDRQPQAKELFILAEDSSAERKNRTYLDPIYWRNGLSTTYGLIRDFDQWKKAFRWGNDHADFIYFANNGGIVDWNHEEAVAHVREYIRIPVFTCTRHMMPYVAVGRVKIAREQGKWAAEQVLRVLGGVSPADIPQAQNQQSELLKNATLLEAIGISIPDEAQ